MSLYHDAAGTLREIDDALYAAWVAAGNPKAAGWTLAPPRPSPAAQWTGAGWAVPEPQPPASVTATQIRLWLVQRGLSLDAVSAAIAATPDSPEREMLLVQWEYSPALERGHPLVAILASALGLSGKQIDQAFVEASRL